MSQIPVVDRVITVTASHRAHCAKCCIQRHLNDLKNDNRGQTSDFLSLLQSHFGGGCYEQNEKYQGQQGKKT